MARCGNKKTVAINPVDPCNPPAPCCGILHNTPVPAASDPFAWFANMIQNCYEYAQHAKKQGRPIVGIMCEYTPRELIMAAGGVPVCLCGGSADTIPAAEEDLPANLCPLIKSTYGYHRQETNPFLEMADLLVAETTCDGKKKMYELLGQKRPLYVLELPQKSDDVHAFEHWLRELRKLKEVLEKSFQVKITDDRLRQAIRQMNQERNLRRQLADFMAADIPPLTGRELLDFKSSISGINADLEQYQNILCRLRNRKPDNALKHRVRVLMTGVPIVHGAERVLEIIENSGGLVVAMENCTGLKPIREDIDENAPDPIEALARKYFHLPCSVMTVNAARMDLLRQLHNQYRPQCIIELIWQGCLTYQVESFFVKDLAGQLHIPYLQIETDYSPSDTARIQVRVQALFETIRGSMSE